MESTKVTEADVDEAMVVGDSNRQSLRRDDPAVQALAAAVSVRRRLQGKEAVTDDELLAAHDQLHAKMPRRNGGSLEALAEALLGRGIVPAPGEYDGDWWLWWPKKGYGPCRDCRERRSLTRYSAKWGKSFRYLCARCRKQELADDSAYLNSLTGVTPEEGESAESLFSRRAAALIGKLSSQAVPERQAGPPDADQWGEYVDRLMEVLSPLDWAGWEVPDEYDSGWDAESGQMLSATLWRTNAALDVEYYPRENRLRFLPYEDVCGDFPVSSSALDEEVELTVTLRGDEAVTTVRRRAGAMGLLDATRVRVAEGADPEAAEALEAKSLLSLFGPAASYRNIPVAEVLKEAVQHPDLSTYLRWVVGMAGRNVHPDPVPDGAALGIAAWCWRNETAVETHHLSSDVLMARVDIAVTRAVLPHVCPYEGIDWGGIEQSLTDTDWELPNGRTISSLFGDGWPEVQSTVREQVRKWQRLDSEILGLDTTLRLMTIGGSTSYTCHWWGQGRWRAICEEIVRDAVEAGFSLPQPYDCRGPDALIDDLEHPDLQSDAVLDWLIDMPEATVSGPHGLRHHPVTQPLVREYDPWWVTPEGD
ncbi:hypothetical protein ITI46_10175 [Streptomyces oryzae]|uniref:Uncharacterized protein n=1 Tax=Streptomyces oryzae TaxID=1434886 RepID=A0ABS3X9K0_9ACTN|nr:hypothetical protein [Streptomyces oryzae]MBO8192031.1 hypothetical protein [Streptomyces oryzae]